MSTLYAPPELAVVPWKRGHAEGIGWAKFSPCERYRYRLGRSWAPPGPRLVFVGLNPSTAEAGFDDPTIRKICGFAMRWGMTGLDMLNLFAMRSTDPRALSTPPPAGPVGTGNATAIAQAFERARMRADRVVFGWGNNVRLAAGGSVWAERVRSTALDILNMEVWCFRMTKEGQPQHPLYLSDQANLIRMEASS